MHHFLCYCFQLLFLLSPIINLVCTKSLLPSSTQSGLYRILYFNDSFLFCDFTLSFLFKCTQLTNNLYFFNVIFNTVLFITRLGTYWQHYSAMVGIFLQSFIHLHNFKSRDLLLVFFEKINRQINYPFKPEYI